MKVDVCVVGAGFAGCTVAERLASSGARVLILERRSHLGGNAYDELDSHGVLVHRYGPHIFHTNSARIVDYLSRFTEWRSYEHRVRAVVDGREFPIPINRDTINSLYGLSLDEASVGEYLESVREPYTPARSSEEVVLNAVGRDLYEKFFLNYTLKQWGRHPRELAAGVTARIPVRTNCDDRYFSDTYQLMPLAGYTRMFEKMIDHPLITVRLETDFQDMRKHLDARTTVFTGPIDAYFDYCFGHLPYRSIRFEHVHFSDQRFHQSVTTLNYPNDHAFTRVTEFKRLTGQDHQGTSIVREYPRDDGEPYYPVPTEENERLYNRYVERAVREPNVTFVGRLAQYRYYNMDQVVAAALKAAERIVSSR